MQSNSPETVKLDEAHSDRLMQHNHINLAMKYAITTVVDTI